MNKTLQQFKEPANACRGVPFWAWNAKLEPKELIRQIRIMKEMGFGGFFMHSRVGMNTPYLSDEWFKCIETCISEAEKLDMNAWLYDEDRWPSGAAGGLVTKDPKYRQRTLKYEEVTGKIEQQSGDIWFVISYERGQISAYERVADPDNFKLNPMQHLYRFRICLNEPDSWFNDQTYLDTMNPEAVRKFLEVTHEEYRKRFHGKFGGVVPGIFSDEPNFCHVPPEDGVPWTDALPKKFKVKFGYDICDHLPELCFDCGKKISFVRRDFRDILTDLFVHSFVEQIGKWCEKNNLLMTGHIFNEDSFNWQTRAVGAVMRAYEFMQMPGIDLLTERWQNFNTIKQCASAARQCGKVRRLTETYGCTGWDFPFMGHKALGDWQYALGINFRCQHLAWYSMEAEAKRDYPASISFQSSWYKKYSVVEDYFARLSTIMTGGQEIRDVLVIHPIESYWSMYYQKNTSVELENLDTAFTEMTARLLALNIDFDFGDEEMMSRMAKIEGNVFKVGLAEYKAILIPELKCIRSSTLHLLKEWAERGGTVVYLGAVPEYVDARPSDEAQKVYKLFTKGDLTFADEKLLQNGRRLSVTDPCGTQIEPVLSRLAEKDRAYNLFLCNTGMHFVNTWGNCFKMVRDRNYSFPKAEIRVMLPENGDVYELDPFTGKIFRVPYRYEQETYIFRTGFAPLQSHLYLFTRENPDELSEKSEFYSEFPAGQFASQNWQYSLSDLNTLVLDHLSLKVNGKEELQKSYFILADDHLRSLLGVRTRGGAMVQPWCRDRHTPEKKLQMELEYQFECEALPQEQCYLALERPELYAKIIFNGKEISGQTDTWWVDPVLKTLALPQNSFRKGGNTLQVIGEYHENLPGLESMFILGKFGVIDEKITALPAQLQTGDWTRQGLMEYSGDVIYSQNVNLVPEDDEHIFIRLNAWRGTAIGISVNDSAEQIILAPPFESDVTPFVKSGSNEFKIRIYGNRRNVFGPFFSGHKWQGWVGPDQFKQYVSPVRELVPCGLLSTPELLARQVLK